MEHGKCELLKMRRNNTENAISEPRKSRMSCEIVGHHPRLKLKLCLLSNGIVTVTVSVTMCITLHTGVDLE